MCANSDGRSTARFSNAARALARVIALPGASLDESSAICRQAAGHHDDLLAASLRELADRLAASDREAFARSYARLFLGPFDVRVPPYASWFLDPEQRMMGPVAQEAAEAYAACGVGPSDGPRELPDHAAVELEFCYLLGYRAVEEGNVQAFGVLADFWRDHVMPWMPRFSDAIAEHSDHPVFDAVVDALDALTAYGPGEPLGLVMEGAARES